MQWTPGGSSDDIEDRRDQGGGGFRGGGFGVGGLGIGGIIVVGLLSLLFRQNLFTLFTGEGGTRQVQTVPDRQRDAREQPQVEFVKFVVNDVQNTWDQTLPEEARHTYRHAKLVLFRDATYSGCGTAREAIGPFYCPADEK